MTYLPYELTYIICVSGMRVKKNIAYCQYALKKYLT